MTVKIFAGWTFGSSLPSATMTVTEATGGLDFDITCDGSGIQYDDSAGGAKTVYSSTTTWSHYPLYRDSYDYFDDDLAAALSAASAAHGNAWTYTVTFDAANFTYTISAAEGNVALSMSSPMALLLGFQSTTQSSAASHTSDARPYYIVLPYLGARSKLVTFREPSGLIGGKIASERAHYSIAPTALPKQYDWVHEFEEDGASAIATAGTGVFIQEHSQTAAPWTWEHFFQHCRSVEPFGVFDSTAGNKFFTHFLRPEHAHFTPRRRQADWDQWDIELKTYWEGTLITAGGTGCTQDADCVGGLICLGGICGISGD